jgi:oxygen-dependent protoporphyrinogen oxidase
MDRKIIVVGGGISGLAAAYWLSRGGGDVEVLEQGPRPGGTMQTICEDGWLVETGPNSALETTPLFTEMFEGLNITEERVYADPRSLNRYILRGGVLYPLPLSPPAFFGSRLWSFRGKLRLLKEPFVGRAPHDETVADFVSRRLGREFLDYAINPFVAGVYAGNPESLSVRHAFPKLYALEKDYGGLIRGMIGGARERRKRAEVAKDRARMFSFRNGMETFPDAVGRMLGGRFRPGHRVTAIAPRPASDGRPLPGFIVRFVGPAGEGNADADVVILAVPAAGASHLLRGMGRPEHEIVRDIYYPPVAQVFLGYREERIPRALDGFGYLVPALERKNILGTIWSSALFPGRAPRGCAALTTFVGGSRQPGLVSLDDVQLVKTVREDLSAIMGISHEPLFRRVIRWESAIPQYTLGYERVLAALETVERELPGLLFCGNYRGGIAVGDCVIHGERTATRALALPGRRDDRIHVTVGGPHAQP